MFEKSTEKESNHQGLDKMSTTELLRNINKEDKTVPETIAEILSDIETVVDRVSEKLGNGGRLFYLGAGTSGRLGILDASECPPTYGVPHEMVIGLIAGGDTAIRKAVENAEDDPIQGWKDLEDYQISDEDFVIGIAASGTTPYVIGALEECNKRGILTACITCNAGSPLSQVAQFPIVAVVGPEFVTGSTRMKAGTAQKLILNMISTASMIKLGKVVGNKMVDMQLSNAKLVQRAIKMIREATGTDMETAKQLLNQEGSVRKAVEAFRS